MWYCRRIEKIKRSDEVSNNDALRRMDAGKGKSRLLFAVGKLTGLYTFLEETVCYTGNLGLCKKKSQLVGGFTGFIKEIDNENRAKFVDNAKEATVR